VNASRGDRSGGELRWHILARWVALAALGAGTVFAGSRGIVESVRPLLLICGLIASYNVAVAVLSCRGWNPDRLTSVSLCLDTAALTAFLHYSGDIENPLLFAYSLPVAAMAILRGKKHGMGLAALSLGLFGALMAFTLLDALPLRLAHHHLNLLHDFFLHERIDPDLSGQGFDYIATHAMILSVLVLGSAFGFGTLAERLREKEVAIRRENDKMSILFRILPEGVVLLTPQGKILLANEAARRLIGDLGGHGISGVDSRLGIARRLAGFKGPAEEFETVWDGRSLAHALAAGSPEGPYVWIFRDVTEERRLLGQVMHASKMADLGLLAAGIAHEIGNPLSSMSAIVQILELKKAPPEISDHLKVLGTQVERIGKIVQDVSAFARPSSDRKTCTPLRALVDRALGIFRYHEKAKTVTVEVASSEPSMEIEAVEDQVVQVLLNLLLNAADALGGAGKVTVSISSEGRDVAVSVADRGPGMSEEVQRRLFTPFFTTKEPGKGQGLGLFISQAIARGHGGRIDVQSAPGQGSTFTLRIPRSRKAA
jgi:signal transduction histidine kinase